MRRHSTNLYQLRETPCEGRTDRPNSRAVFVGRAKGRGGGGAEEEAEQGESGWEREEGEAG
jgi:hypothetical protein